MTEVVKRDISTAIWLTSKVRMLAERKLRRLNTILCLLMLYYSFASLAVHLFSRFIVSFYQAEIGALFAVISLFLNFMPLSWRPDIIADKYRECYLELERLNSSSEYSKIDLYHEILAKYPNHSDTDYKDFMVEQRFYGRDITDSSGFSIKTSLFIMISYWVRKIIYILMIAVAFGIPITYFLWVCR
ncbi:SLATT domain-containing protein [Candidatus Liberibacter americanus]|uniref:SMODS and SLOG-associating 2TM effector domain-containing protein n=1 Tax=Candidatus Liberibacter americanus str. Sao Paulo TaxID=1261131 RepID=U6B819_9HYPH|nr:SLATT domain-containing protein [Candidatus Liberibacter americanus]AHA28006.1 hypothetical protein lam_660 [Candidatus Liberibacter americanus str. Sao Paulo]EMS35797.1 hypothetical protein G653_04831 [Candidatus Liberibacter americanus PW_SP]